MIELHLRIWGKPSDVCSTNSKNPPLLFALTWVEKWSFLQRNLQIDDLIPVRYTEIPRFAKGVS